MKLIQLLLPALATAQLCRIFNNCPTTSSTLTEDPNSTTTSISISTSTTTIIRRPTSSSTASSTTSSSSTTTSISTISTTVATLTSIFPTSITTETTAVLTITPAADTQGDTGGLTVGNKIAIIVASVLAAIVVLGLISFCIYRKAESKKEILTLSLAPQPSPSKFAAYDAWTMSKPAGQPPNQMLQPLPVMSQNPHSGTPSPLHSLQDQQTYNEQYQHESQQHYTQQEIDDYYNGRYSDSYYHSNGFESEEAYNAYYQGFSGDGTHVGGETGREYHDGSQIHYDPRPRQGSQQL